MDVDSQVEEFDSSSSDGSDSSSSDEEPPSEEERVSGQEESTVKVAKSRKRRRDRKKHTAGLRKTLRTHYESVEDFNPEARIAQSAEMERIRRLELQQSITSPSTHTHTPVTASHHPPHTLASQEHSSPEMVVVDLSNKTSPPKDTIVIESDSGSDSDTVKKKAPPLKVGGQPTSTRGEVLHRKYEDPTVPRPDGRVVVNVSHNVNEPDVILAPQVARIVKPHQIGGIRFLYDNIIESLGRYSSSPGFGCILAHSMGLGKTLQVISFIDVFMRYTPAKHALCVVPVNTLQNWVNEFDRWLPANQNPSSSHLTGLLTPDTQHRTFGLFLLSESTKTMESRVKVITDWQEVGGVILIGYEMFRLLSLSVPSLAGNKMAVKRRKNAPPKAETINLDETEKEMDALIGIQRALCDPGPDLVVCDEGHRIKNDVTNISQALKRIRTRRRIVMTGYPLQNNLTEYWCMVDFVRPKYLGTKQEFADLFDRPITNGQCADSTPNDVRLMRYRSHVLHSLLEGFVLRRGHEILKSTLPPKFEHVLFLRPSEVQGILYNYNMSLIEQGGGVSASNGPLKAFAVCTKIWNHPDIYYQEVVAQGGKDPSHTRMLDEAGLPKPATSGLKVGGESSCKIDWPHSQLPSYTPDQLEHSPKMAVLMELIDKSVHYRDKILVFSQSLSTLSCVERILTHRPVPIPDSGMGTGNGAMQYQNLTWTKNKHYCRLDGSTGSMERDKLITAFNAPSNNDCWVFLLSTKAGCLGINLIGANRVVVLDVSWNPCYDAQAVCRVYRYGQTKPCYIYRLVCDGTMERKIYDRQISKQGMSDRVVDHLQPERHLSTQDIISLTAPLTSLPPSRDLSPFAPDYLFDPVLMALCYTSGQLLTKLPFKHESLLVDSVNERMTELEKYQALTGFQAELRALKNGPASIHEFRAMQAKNTPLPSSVPGILATPTPPPMLPVPPPMLVCKPTPTPVITNPNQPIEIICLDSDEDDKTSTTPPKPSPVTFEPTKPVQSSILSAQAQLYFNASQKSSNLIPINPMAPPTTITSGDQSALSGLSKTPPTIEPSVTTVTTEQLSEMAEGIVDSLKSQLLTTSLTRCQQDQTKMAVSGEPKKKGNESSQPGGGQNTTELLRTSTAEQSSAVTSGHVIPLADNRGQSSTVTSGHVIPLAENRGQSSTVTSGHVIPPLADNRRQEQTSMTQDQTEGPNIYLNSNSNNAVEETNKLTIVASSSAESDGVTVSNKEGWRSQSEKSRKAAKKERSCGTASSWKPPYPPPPPPTTHFPPCSIPLLSPIAAHLLYISTGTKLPSSPPEDMFKYPPIVSPSPSSHAPSSPEAEMDWYDHDEESETNSQLELSNIESENTIVKSKSPETFRLRTMLTGDSNGREDNVANTSTANTSTIVSHTSSKDTIITTTSVCQGESKVSTTKSASSATVYPMICSPLPLRGQSSHESKSTIGQDKSQYSKNFATTKTQLISNNLTSTTVTVPTYTRPIISSNITLSNNPLPSSGTFIDSTTPNINNAPPTNVVCPQETAPSFNGPPPSQAPPTNGVTATNQLGASGNYNGHTLSQSVPSKPKWIRSFSASEIPVSKGRGSTTTEPPTSTNYDPQPILCIDNWTKGPTTNDTENRTLATMTQPLVKPLVAKRPIVVPSAEISTLPVIKSNPPNIRPYRSHSTSTMEDKRLFLPHPSLSSTRSYYPQKTPHSLNPNLFGLDTDESSKVESMVTRTSDSSRVLIPPPQTSVLSRNNHSPWKQSISDGKSNNVNHMTLSMGNMTSSLDNIGSETQRNVSTLSRVQSASAAHLPLHSTSNQLHFNNSTLLPGNAVSSITAGPHTTGHNVAGHNITGLTVPNISGHNSTGPTCNTTGHNVAGSHNITTGHHATGPGHTISGPHTTGHHVAGPRHNVTNPNSVSGHNSTGPAASNIVGHNVIGTGHQITRSNFAGPDITGPGSYVTGHLATVSTLPVHHGGYTPHDSSPDRLSSFSRDSANGGTCVLSSTHPRAVFRTKKTAVVTPYCVVNKTSTDYTTKLNTKTNISISESLPLATRTQPSLYSPQKLTALPQTMTGTKLGITNSSNPWMKPSIARASVNAATQGIALSGQNQNLFQQNYQKMPTSCVLNTRNGIGQNGIGTSQNVSNNAIYRNRVQSCSDSFARTQLSPTILPSAVPQQRMVIPPTTILPQQRMVTPPTTNLSNSGHLSYNGDTLNTEHFTSGNSVNTISPAYTASATERGWSNTQQTPSATERGWSNTRSARRYSVDSRQDNPRMSFSHHSTHRTATPPHNNGAFPGSHRTITPPHMTSTPPHNNGAFLGAQTTITPPHNGGSFLGSHRTATPPHSDGTGQRYIVSVPPPPKSSGNPFDQSLLPQVFTTAPLSNAPLSTPAYPVQSGFSLPPQRPASLPMSNLPNWTGGGITPSVANRETALPSTTTQSPYRLGTPDSMGISPTPPQLPRTTPNQLGISPVMEIPPLPQHLRMSSNHRGSSPAINTGTSPVRQLQLGISPTPTSQPLLLGSSSPCSVMPLSQHAGHTSPAHLRAVPPPYLGPISTEHAHTTNSHSQNGNYAIPSLYRHRPRPPPRQVLSPTHPTRLPSFDQFPQGQRSTETYCQQGYSGCHENCRVGVATRMCK